MGGSSETLKWNKEERLRVVNQGLIDRLEVSQIRDLVEKELGRGFTKRTIERDIKELGEKATRFFFLLAKDNDYYNQKLRITIDSLEETLSDLKKEYKNTVSYQMKPKLAEAILHYEREIYEYYKFLPMLKQPGAAPLEESTEPQEEEVLPEPVL